MVQCGRGLKDWHLLLGVLHHRGGAIADIVHSCNRCNDSQQQPVTPQHVSRVLQMDCSLAVECGMVATRRLARPDARIVHSCV
eukprot:COSAG05_NODE_2118_length_3536_cov_3.709340_3_plen_83_part_00